MLIGTNCKPRDCLTSHFGGQENCSYKLTHVLNLLLLTVTKIVAKCLSLDCSSDLSLTQLCFVLVTHPCNPNPCKENQVCDINRSCYGALLDRCQSYTCVPGNYLFIACNEGFFQCANGVHFDLRWFEIVFIFPRLVLQILFQLQFGLSYQCEIYHRHK